MTLYLTYGAQSATRNKADSKRRTALTSNSKTCDTVWELIGDWLESVAAFHWLESVAGLHWLEFVAGLHWLESVAGLHWLESTAGLHWLESVVELHWLECVAALHWLEYVAGIHKAHIVFCMCSVKTMPSYDQNTEEMVVRLAT